MSSEMHNKSETRQEHILAQAVERLAAGEGLDAILEGAGADADWLRPLLILVAEVRDLRQAAPIPPIETSQARFLAEAERIASELPGKSPLRRWWERWADNLRLAPGSVPRLAGTLATVVLTVVALMLGSAFLLGGSSASAAESVLPGQPLYPIKRLGEEIYLRLPQSHESRSARSAAYDERRRNEVHQLLDSQLGAGVTFRGRVESLNAQQVVVSGIAALITDKTRIEGPLASGAQVLVEGRTLPAGMLIAQRILVERPGQPAPLPSPTATPRPSATATATPGATATPSNTATPTATATPTQQATHTPEPTANPSVESTQPLILSTPETREPTAASTPTLVPIEETPEAPEAGEDNGDDQDKGHEEEKSDDGNDNSDDGDNVNSVDGQGNDDGGDQADGENKDEGGDNEDDAANQAGDHSDNGGGNEDNDNDNEAA